MSKIVVKSRSDFERQLAKLPKASRMKVVDAIELLLEHPAEPSLRNHELTGEWSGYHSISADDDLRVHFKMVDDHTLLLVAVGTHRQLYK